MSNNPYAPPKSNLALDSTFDATDHNSGLRVENNAVVSPKDHSWPDRCIVCNAPANGYKSKRKLYWHHPALYVLILLSALIYVIVAMIVRKQAVLQVALCEHHRKKRRLGFIIGWVGFGVSLVGIFVAGGANVTFLMPVFVIGMLAAPLTGIILARNLTVVRIDQTHAWIKTGKPFLNSITW